MASRISAIGLIGFAAASAVGGAAASFEMLVAARAGQGIFGALLAPAALSLVTTTFTNPHERGRACAIYGAIAGGGSAIGLLLGGALTEFLSWRWCLYVNLPIALGAVFGGALLLPRSRRADDATGLDVSGSVLSIAGFLSLVYGLADAETEGWTRGATYEFIAVGIALLAAFVVVERRVEDPLLPMTVLADRDRGGSFVTLGLFGAGMFGVFLFLTYYLSTVLDYQPLTTEASFLPVVFVLAVSAQIVPQLIERIGAKIPVSGFAIAAGGMVFFTRLELDSTYVAGVLPGLIIVGAGLGLVFAPAMSAATDRVDPGDAGVASAAVDTFQQIGDSIGTAVLSLDLPMRSVG